MEVVGSENRREDLLFIPNRGNTHSYSESTVQMKKIVPLTDPPATKLHYKSTRKSSVCHFQCKSFVFLLLNRIHCYCHLAGFPLPLELHIT